MKIIDLLPLVESLPDPRDPRRSKRFHKLSDILLMALGATLCGKQPRGAELLAVSAWSSAGGLCLATHYADSKAGKGSELPAMVCLVQALDLSGCVATADAMGTNNSLAKAVVARGGDYVLALKDNQKLSHEWAKDWFAHAKPAPA